MLNIIGGSYFEQCIQPFWDELYGSGLRSVLSLHGRTPLRFYTYSDSVTLTLLNDIALLLQFELKTYTISKNVEFVYEHPLSNPSYFPKKIDFIHTEKIHVVTKENIICFGMIEGNASVSGDKVVYDPQDPSNPKSFYENGSNANKLIIILNWNEAILLSGTSDIREIQDYFLNKEKAFAAILKSGADGAYVIQGGSIELIPAFITEKVWPIGSGDIFTSHFGYNWMIENKTVLEAAWEASMATAYFASSKALPIPPTLPAHLTPFYKKPGRNKKVYLAGPFFTMGQRWMINQFRDALSNVGFDVFSPFHDVGIGKPEKVAPLDLKGIDDCDIVVALVDGLDSGTLFEIGYAKAKSKFVMVFMENEKEESLTMLKGTNCLFEDDFSSIIYKTIWQAYSE